MAESIFLSPENSTSDLKVGEEAGVMGRYF
jgi:hypothetical protein